MKSRLFLLLLIVWVTPLLSAQTENKELKVNSTSNLLIENLDEVHKLSDKFQSQLIESQYVLYVQFDEIPKPKIRQHLVSLGIQFDGYIPNLTYRLIIPKSLSLQALKSAGATHVFSNSEHVLLDRTLHKQLVEDHKDLPLDFNLRYIPSLNPQAIIKDLESSGIKILSHHPSSYKIKMTASRNELLVVCRKPYVVAISKVNKNLGSLDYPNTTVYGSRYLNKTSGLTGEKVVVGVGDSGGWGHPDGRKRSTNYTNNTNAFHSNQVSGIIAGNGNLYEKFTGHAPAATIINRGYDEIISNLSTDCPAGMVLTNNSYGDTDPDCPDTGVYNATSQDIDEDFMTYPQLLHVASSGNSGGNSICGNAYNSVVQGIQSAKNSLTVGGLSSTTGIAGYSSRGPVKDGRLKPEICANATTTVGNTNKNDYRIFGGTSAASPVVTGTLALLYQYFRDENSNMDPDGGLIKAIACNTAIDYGNPGPDYTFGFGRVDPWRATKVIKESQYITGSLNNGANNNHLIDIPANVRQIKVMLYWNDPPASPAATTALINDLDLQVTSPGGTIHLPYVLDPNNPTSTSVPGTDQLNNIEQVVIDIPLTNTPIQDYDLMVTGTMIPMGPQTYYLTYVFIYDDLQLIFPNDGTAVLPCTNVPIVWRSSDEVNPVDIEYSADGGASWNLIDSAPGTDERYTWEVPDDLITGQAQIKVTQGTHVSTGQLFAVIGQPELVVQADCSTSDITLTWDAIDGAASYEIYRQGPNDAEMTSIANITGLSFTFNETAEISECWYSVCAVTATGLEGRRDFGVSASVPALVQVEDAGFTYGVNPTGNNILEVQFTNLTGSTVDNYLWDFGDGMTSTLEHPAHVYSSGGLYTVSLTVTNQSCGAISTQTVSYMLEVSSDPSCAAQDRIQLLSFYYLLDNTYFLDLLGWGPSTPVNTWGGVTLNANGCVDQFDLINVWVGSTVFKGYLPNLRFEELTRLLLTGLKGGSVDGLHLPNAERIVLPGNNLTGTLSDFGNPPGLFFLTLDNNKLTGPIPAYSSTLYNLSLENNNFNFDGMYQYLAPPNPVQLFSYAPQYNLPIAFDNGTFSVNAGGALADNTYKWYKKDASDVLVDSIVGNETFTPADFGEYYCKITNANIPGLELISETGSYFDEPVTSLLIGFRAWLSRAYDPGTGLLPTDLKDAGHLPLLEPYTALGLHNKSETTTAATIASLPVVDWVLIEVRHKYDYNNILETKAGLLLENGHIYDVDGANKLNFESIASGDYYFSIRHRNHLGAMTKFPRRTNQIVNFKTVPLFGKDGVKILPNGQQALVPGDHNLDGSIDSGDRSETWNQRNTIGYLEYDYDLSGHVNAVDRATVWNNRNYTSQIPGD